jgi:CBS domain-containing protein
MNPQMLYVADGDGGLAVRAKLLGFGVSGAPVLDASYRPVGFVSLRDIAPDGDATITRPAAVIEDSVGVEAAARALAESGRRRFVVVDGAGRAVGVVSAIDFVRALVGLPPRHPPRFDVDCGSARAFADTEPDLR